MKLRHLLLPLALLAPTASAQEALPVTGLPAEDPVTQAILHAEDLQVMDHLEELSEGIGPRLTSSDKLTEACAWAAGVGARARPGKVGGGGVGVLKGHDHLVHRERVHSPRRHALALPARACLVSC